MRTNGDIATGPAVPAGLVLAAVFGAIHAAFSIYLFMGGTWLVWSLGSNLLILAWGVTLLIGLLASRNRTPQ